jgi:hypothetical protein
MAAKTSLCLWLSAALLLQGCFGVSRRRRARIEQGQLDQIGRIQNPQRRLEAVSRVLIEAAAGGNIHVAQEIFSRYPGLVNQPNWPQVKMSATKHAIESGHEDIVHLIVAADHSRRPEPAPMASVRWSTPPKAGAAPPPAPAAAPAIVSDVDEPAYITGSRDDDFALVIGVEKYSKLPEARFAQRDAEAVKRHLLALGYPQRNVITLLGESATRGALQGYLEEWLPKNVKPDSTVFVYYSGHGAPDPASGQAFLVPWDGDPRFLQSTAYPLKQLYGDLAKLKAKSTIVALDSCFSGAGGRSVLADGARPLVAHVDDAPAEGSLTVLTAAGGDEITSTLPDQGHGLFTYFLLKGLTKGKRNARQLYDFLKPRVQDEASRQNRQQTPALLGIDAPL